MKLSFSPFATAVTAAAVLAASTTTVVDALPTGAASCPAGVAAPPVGHSGTSSSGTVEDAGLTITTSLTDMAGQYTVTLNGGPEFKGYLFRATDGNTVVFDAGSTGQEATACADEDAVGVTHTDRELKTEVMATFSAPDGATEAVVDVSVVVDFATYYYSGVTVDLTAAVVEEGGEEEEEATEPAPAEPDVTEAPTAATAAELDDTAAPTAVEPDVTEAPAPAEPEATEAPAPSAAAATGVSTSVVGLFGTAAAAAAAAVLAFA